MDTEEGFNRYRYKTRVQVVAVIDMLVGTFPFIDLAFAFNDKTLAEVQDREYLVLAWMTILCVYVLQFIMGIWLLAATRECYSEYTVGNCQVWYYIAMFTFVFYIGEMGYAISVILKTPRDQTVKKVMLTMLFHATKIIYRAVTLMTVNNFLYDVCRPVHKYLSQGSYMYTSYYNYLHGIPPPQRRRRLSSVTTNLLVSVKPRANSNATNSEPLPSTTRALASTTITASATAAVAGQSIPLLLPQRQQQAAAAVAAATAAGPGPIFLQQHHVQHPVIRPPPLPPLATSSMYLTNSNCSPPILQVPPGTPATATLIYSPPPPPPNSANAIHPNHHYHDQTFDTGLPVYNETKLPHQPLPNYNFYFTYPQPKTKQYQQLYGNESNQTENDYYNYYTVSSSHFANNPTTTNSMKQPP